MKVDTKNTPTSPTVKSPISPLTGTSLIKPPNYPRDWIDIGEAVNDETTMTVKLMHWNTFAQRLMTAEMYPATEQAYQKWDYRFKLIQKHILA